MSSAVQGRKAQIVLQRHRDHADVFAALLACRRLVPGLTNGIIVSARHRFWQAGSAPGGNDEGDIVGRRLPGRRGNPAGCDAAPIRRGISNELLQPTVSATYTTVAGSTIVLNATAIVKTDIMNIFGYDQVTITGGTGTGTVHFTVQLNGTADVGATETETIKSKTRS